MSNIHKLTKNENLSRQVSSGTTWEENITNNTHRETWQGIASSGSHPITGDWTSQLSVDVSNSKNQGILIFSDRSWPLYFSFTTGNTISYTNVTPGDGTFEEVADGTALDSVDNWSGYVNTGDSASATFKVEDDDAYAGSRYLETVISHGGDGISDLQFYSTGGFNIREGKGYKVSFYAKAASARQLNFSIMQQASPYKSYVEEYNSNSGTSVTLTTSYALYSYVFTANTSASDARLQFFLGNDTNNVKFDNVKVEEISAPLSGDDISLALGQKIFLEVPDLGESVYFNVLPKRRNEDNLTTIQIKRL